jgi:mersacidin/lichenicidin family type 2 lantibiotic
MSGYEIIRSWKNEDYLLIASTDRPEMLANPAGEIELTEDERGFFSPTHHCPTIGGAFTCDGHFTCVVQ